MPREGGSPIDRRAFMDRVTKLAVSAAAASAMVDQLMPNHAAAQQVSPTDSRLVTARVSVPSPAGHGAIGGLLVRPRPRAGWGGVERLPAILIVHDNGGLNPHIEDIARRLALSSFMTFAPDALTSVGGYPGDDGKAGALFATLDRARMDEDLHAAAVWLKNRADSTGRLGAIGFGVGGGIANALAVRMGADLGAVVSFDGGAPAAADEAWARTVLRFIKSLT